MNRDLSSIENSLGYSFANNKSAFLTDSMHKVKYIAFLKKKSQVIKQHLSCHYTIIKRN